MSPRQSVPHLGVVLLAQEVLQRLPVLRPDLVLVALQGGVPQATQCGTKARWKARARHTHRNREGHRQAHKRERERERHLTIHVQFRHHMTIMEGTCTVTSPERVCQLPLHWRECTCRKASSDWCHTTGIWRGSSAKRVKWSTSASTCIASVLLSDHRNLRNCKES